MTFSRFFSRSTLFVLLLLLNSWWVYAQQPAQPAAPSVQNIHIVAPVPLQANDAVHYTLEDIDTLLDKALPHGECTIGIGDPLPGTVQANDLIIRLPELTANAPSPFQQETDFPLLPNVDEGYTWQATAGDTNFWRKPVSLLELEARSFPAVSHALYGLLQEQFGILFLHPRQTVVKPLAALPYPLPYSWRSAPRFDKRGFHLHTQHPLELTEQLHNPAVSDTSLQDLKAYINWLARNRQNAFQYYLLRTINPESWGAQMDSLVRYAHQRHIFCGLKLSLHSVQQYAYQLVGRPLTDAAARRQVDKRLGQLFQADWDYLSVDLSRAEFFGDAGKRTRMLEHYLIDRLAAYGAKFFYNTHVIQQENVGFKQKAAHPAGNPHIPAPGRAGDSARATGILIHSVMAYSLREPYAPVYGNQNFNFMWEAAVEHAPVHETWYFPESAYWITYDNSVPLFVMPYLRARLQDILATSRAGLVGHVTFSSGWEWSYWSIDYSIARWCWQEFPPDTTKAGYPRTEELPLFATMYLQPILADDSLAYFLEQQERIQHYWMKDRNLLRFLNPQQVTDELPPPYNKPFQPRPEWRLKEVWKDFSAPQVRQLLDTLNALQVYARQTERYCDSLEARWVSRKMQDIALGLNTSHHLNPEWQALFNELLIGLRVNALRARHRYHTLAYLCGERLEKLGRLPGGHRFHGYYLDKAARLRRQAMVLVRAQEDHFRYPVHFLAGRRKSRTAYQHGYLYTAHKLHFWQREEEQVRQKRFGPLFRNVWNVGRISGVVPGSRK